MWFWRSMVLIAGFLEGRGLDMDVENLCFYIDSVEVG
jgi:hypothetical protein